MSKKYPGSEPPTKIGPYDPDEGRVSVSWTGHDHWKDSACAVLERQLAEYQQSEASLGDAYSTCIAERDEAQGKLEAVAALRWRIYVVEGYIANGGHRGWMYNSSRFLVPYILDRILSKEGNE